MSGHANGPAAITSDTAHRAACSDRGGLAAAGAARGASKVPGIAGLSGEKVVGLVGHQKFRRVGVAKKGARGARPAGDVDRTLDGQGHAVKSAPRLTAWHGRFGRASLRASPVCVQVSKGMEPRFERGDAAEMRLDKFCWRQLPRANVSGHFRDRGGGRCGHKRTCESMRRMGCGSSKKQCNTRSQTTIKKI